MAAEGGAAAGDEFLWLEELQGKSAAMGAAGKSAHRGAFRQGEDFQRIEREVLDILNKDTQIPWVSKRGEYYYNFWQDQANPRGLLRRTTLDEYRKAKPAGRRCWISMRWARRKARIGSIRARNRWRRNTAIA